MTFPSSHSLDSPIIEIQAAERERHHDSGYKWVNADRPVPETWVVKRTLKGRAFYRPNEGSVRYVNPEQAMLFSHRDGSTYGYPQSDSGPYECEYLSLRGPLAASLCTAIVDEYGPVVSLAEQGEAAALFASTLLQNRTKQFLDTWHASELVYRFFVSLWREQSGERRKEDPIDFCRIQIETRFDQPITVKELADAANLTREDLTRAFARRFGQSPGKLLRDLRLESAKKILLSTSMDFEAVSRASGYISSDSFARAFKGATGLSPRDFRQRFSSNGATRP